MKPVIYLDWNVISYLCDPGPAEGRLGAATICLRALLDGMIDRNSLVTPYSHGHLLDIRKGPNERQEAWLECLEATTGNWKIMEIPNNRESVGLWQTVSASADFRAAIAELDRFDASFAPTQKALSALAPPMHDMFPPLEGSNPNRDLLGPLYDKLARGESFTGLDALRFYKAMRHNLRHPDGRRVKFPDAKSVGKNTAGRSFREVVDAAIARSDLPYDSYEELDRAVPKIGSFGFLSSFTDGVNRLAMIAGMLGIGTEKLKQKRAWQAVVNDIFHLSFGLRSHYIVTEDVALREKALFVKRMLNLPVKVLDVDGLNQELLTQLAPHYEPPQGGEKAVSRDGPLTFRFLDPEGQEIRSYSVKTDREGIAPAPPLTEGSQ